MSKPEPFDPSRYLTKIGSADYLEVKWRLVWLRDVHPEANIFTELVHFSPGDYAIFRAQVTIPELGSATGWGEEDAGDFKDFVEKSETKALGRALAALGFGTQFSGDGEGTAVDPPVQSVAREAKPKPAAQPGKAKDAKPNAAAAKATETAAANGTKAAAEPSPRITPSAVEAILNSALANGWNQAAAQEEAARRFNTSDLSTLTVDQGRVLYKALTAPRQMQAAS